VDDLEALGRAFAAHREDVVRVCRRLLGAAEDARDAPQEVFLRASRSFHTYDRGRPLRPWLLAIAGNYCIDRLREQAAEQRLFAEVDPEEAPPDAEADAASPLGRLVALEERDAVGRAIAELPLKYRLPLALRYFSDLEYAAIAGILGVSRNQVGTLLFRAKAQLRDALRETRGGRGRR
jgi:RNA polymerase sigma-70 factor (ECF subfamily)